MSTTTSYDVRVVARAWADDDPDPRDRAEIEALLADGGDAAMADLADRFSGRLEFGTAGLRGAVGAGPHRMNRAVVRAATAGLAAWLRQHRPESSGAGVVIGCDARHRSDEFAEEAARVLAGAGFRVHLLPPRLPTPVLAFAVLHVGAAAGVMVTASHNPPADNGYKLYLGDGAQIVPPVDREVEAAIDAVGRLSGVPLAALDDPLVTRLDDSVVAAYVDAVTSLSPAPPGGDALTVVYTPLHGVARDVLLRAVSRAGFAAPYVVAAQGAPDADFPTVAFPNPEEPGALDLAFADARAIGADLVLANDPDGDRLAVAVPDPDADGGWRMLRGDELGVLLGAYVLDRTAGDADADRRLVATTVVSSTMLAAVAAAADARYAETLTGFKWIVRGAEQVPGTRFVFGYEEALGYTVGEVVRDKDGIGAALATLALTADLRRAGRTLLDRLDDLYRRHGVHLTDQVAVRLPTPADAAAVMRRLRDDPLRELAGAAVVERVDLLRGTAGLPPSDVLVHRLDGARFVVRPSGTEPKLKGYLEVVEPAADDVAPARARARTRLEALRVALGELLASCG
jgi:phosphomannomutase